MCNSGIYMLKNNADGKVYIGQSKDVFKRKSEHFYSLRKGCHYNLYLQRAFDKYGESGFSFIPMEFCSIGDLDDKEVYYINLYDSINRDNGYNLKGGGSRPLLSDETKRKLSETRKERIRNGMIEVRCGYKHSDGVKRKMSDAANKRWTEDERVKTSLIKSTIDIEIVKLIKQFLYMDMDIDDISTLTNVNIDKINHIMNLNSFQYVLSDYNYYIKNRNEIYTKRKIKRILRMYRDGQTFQTISDKLGFHIRTVESNKNEYDELMRERSLSYADKKKKSMIVTMYNMGKTKRYITRALKVSVNTVNYILRKEVKVIV